MLLNMLIIHFSYWQVRMVIVDGLASIRLHEIRSHQMPTVAYQDFANVTKFHRHSFSDHKGNHEQVTT